MKRLIVLLVSILTMNTEASPKPRIQVFEIRKTNENRDVDTNYFDPDGSRKEDYIETMSKIHKKINTKTIDKIMQLLSAHKVQPVNKINHYSNSRLHSKKIDPLDRLRRDDILNFDDKESKLEDLSDLIKYLTRTDDDRNNDNTDLVDPTRSSPLIILSADREEQPQDVTALGKLLQSPLRTEYDVNQDRTSPPRLRRPYDDYY